MGNRGSATWKKENGWLVVRENKGPKGRELDKRDRGP